MSYVLWQNIFFSGVLIGLSYPLGSYMYKVMTGQKVILSFFLAPAENAIYKVMGIKGDEEMGAKKYALSVLLFSAVSLVFLWLLLLLQGLLPFNPERMPPVSLDLAFNTAASFVSNDRTIG